MSKTYSFPCGCEFEVTSETTDGRPTIIFNPNIENIKLDCDRTWDLISAGNTMGVFQLESRLGQSLARKLKPRNIEHLAALLSVMRPGVLEAVRNKKSVTMHYIDRKNSLEDIEYFHPALKSSLQKTYGEMIYQEQTIQIVKDIAGFTLQEGDEIRFAVGKKKSEEMAKIKIKFIDGCKKLNIVTEEESQQIFGWIEKSQKYSFNKSHAVSYALNSYLSAYAKAHFPRAFFTSYLHYAKEKQKPFEEIHELVQNARLMNVDVCGPDFRLLNKHFKLVNGKIYFGFFDIKGIGESAYTKIEKQLTMLNKPVKDWSWLEFLVCFAQNINSTAIISIINSGAISYMGLSRTQMVYEYNLYDKLSPKEKSWTEQYVRSTNSSKLTLKDILMSIMASPTGKMGVCHSDKRKNVINSLLKTLINPTYNLKDSFAWISSIEESLLGIPITCTGLDSCDISEANCTCAEYIQGVNPKISIIACTIDHLSEIKTKTGKNPGQKMSFMKVSDISGSIDVVVFPDKWEDVRKIAFLGNKILISGQRSKNGGSFIVHQSWQI